MLSRRGTEVQSYQGSVVVEVERYTKTSCFGARATVRDHMVPHCACYFLTERKYCTSALREERGTGFENQKTTVYYASPTGPVYRSSTEEVTFLFLVA